MIELKRKENHFFCIISVNDKKALMFLDTGASISYISEEYAENCKVVGKAKSAGQTGNFGSVKLVKELNNITCDGINFNTHNFLIDEKFKKHFSCDGVLGSDFLSKRNFILDFKTDIFSFHSNNLKSGAVFTTNKNKIFFNPTINGVEIENLIFDTGAVNLSIDKDLSKTLNLEIVEPDPELQVSDSNGNLIIFENYKLDSFQLGNLIRQNVKVFGYNFSNSRKLKNFNQNGIIGKSIFDGHIFEFDFGSKFCKVV